MIDTATTRRDILPASEIRTSGVRVATRKCKCVRIGSPLQGGFRFGLRSYPLTPDCYPSPVLQRASILTIEVQTLIVENPPRNCKGGEYLLLLVLSRHGHGDGTSIFPSVERMARQTNQTRRGVEKQLVSLMSKGYIEVVRKRTARPTEYRICIEKFDPEYGSGSKKQTPNIVRKDPEHCSKTPEPCSDDSNDSSLIHQNRQTKTKVKTAVADLALKQLRDLLQQGKRGQ